MKKALFSLTLLATISSGVTLEDINTKPPSREKNFMIWQYLHQDITPEQASSAFYQLENANLRFLTDYAKKTDDSEIIYTVDCLQKKEDELVLIPQDDCLFLALTPDKASHLQHYERLWISNRLNGKFADISWLDKMDSDQQFIDSNDIDKSVRLFLVSLPKYRDEHFNDYLSSETIKKLSENPFFPTFAYAAITDLNLDKLNKSLSQINYGSYPFETHFYLAMNALKYDVPETAYYHLLAAQKKAISPMDSDKINFWLYQVTQKNEYLITLSNSLDINMYVLWSRDLLKLPTENYFSNLPTSYEGGFDGTDPFKWQKFHKVFLESTPDTLYQLIEQNDGNKSVAVQAYMLEKTYFPYIHNFTTPYNDYMSSISNDQKAMLYALMRQETRLIPGLLSPSFALGLMQIMPFNVDSISKANTLKISTYDDMFKPEYSIPYAIEHMKHIDKSLLSPVFKAYAYNGGIGFTRRLITNKRIFLPGKYEPYLSMELVWNAESREYGKKVLANYVIYKKIFNEPVSIISILDNLVLPSRSDFFRASEIKKHSSARPR